MLVKVHYEFYLYGLLYGARCLVEDNSDKSSEDIAKQFCNENNLKLLDFEEVTSKHHSPYVVPLNKKFKYSR